MEPLLETVELDIEESSELLFKVKVEGIEQAPVKVRLVCEVDDLAYMFNGHSTSEEGVVQFLLPVLKGRIKEGTYLSRVEVLIENRYFTPVSFNISFKKAVSVMAEAVKAQPHKVVPQIKVTATPVVVAKPVKKEPVQPKLATLKERRVERVTRQEPETVTFDEASEDMIRDIIRGLV